MSNLVTQIQNLVIRLGTEFKVVHSSIGTLSSLTTTQKSSLVAAINEVRGSVAGADMIDDLASPSETDKTYSAFKITNLLDSLRESILGGASEAFDTLKELQDLLEDDQSGIGALAAAIENKVSWSASQTLTGGQQAQARSNIGAAAASHTHDPESESWLSDALDEKAPIDSPAFTGSPTAPTQISSDNSTKLATTAFVKTQISGVTSTIGNTETDFVTAFEAALT